MALREKYDGHQSDISLIHKGEKQYPSEAKVRLQEANAKLGIPKLLQRLQDRVGMGTIASTPSLQEERSPLHITHMTNTLTIPYRDVQIQYTSESVKDTTSDTIITTSSIEPTSLTTIIDKTMTIQFALAEVAFDGLPAVYELRIQQTIATNNDNEPTIHTHNLHFPETKPLPMPLNSTEKQKIIEEEFAKAIHLAPEEAAMSQATYRPDVLDSTPSPLMVLWRIIQDGAADTIVDTSTILLGEPTNEKTFQTFVDPKAMIAAATERVRAYEQEHVRRGLGFQAQQLLSFLGNITY